MMNATVTVLASTNTPATRSEPLIVTPAASGAARFAAEGRWRIVDLTSVDSVDTALMRTLVALLRQVREHGGGVRLVVAPQTRAYRQLVRAGLDRVFRLYSTVDEAIASVRPPDRRRREWWRARGRWAPLSAVCRRRA